MKGPLAMIWRLAFPLLLVFVFFLIFLHLCYGESQPKLEAFTPIHGSTLGYHRAVAYEDDTLTLTIEATDQILKPYFLLYSLTPPRKPYFLFGGNYVGVDIYNFAVLKRGIIPSSGKEILAYSLNHRLRPWQQVWFQVFVQDGDSPWGFYSSRNLVLKILPPKGRYLMVNKSASYILQYDLKRRAQLAFLCRSVEIDAQSNDLNIILNAHWQQGDSYYYNVSKGEWHHLYDAMEVPPALSPDGDIIAYQTIHGIGVVVLLDTLNNHVIGYIPDVWANQSICVSAYGRYVFMIRGTGQLTIYETHTGSRAVLDDLGGGWEDVVCTPDGKYAAIRHGYEIHLLERETMNLTKIINAFHLNWLWHKRSRSIDISPSGNLIAYLDCRMGKPITVLHDRTTGTTVVIDLNYTLFGNEAIKIANSEKALVWMEGHRSGKQMGTIWVYEWDNDISEGVVSPFWRDKIVGGYHLGTWIN